MVIQALVVFVGLVFGILCFLSHAASRVTLNRADYPPRYK